MTKRTRVTKRLAVEEALRDEFSFVVPVTGRAWDGAVSRVLRALRANVYDVMPKRDRS